MESGGGLRPAAVAWEVVVAGPQSSPLKDPKPSWTSTKSREGTVPSSCCFATGVSRRGWWVLLSLLPFPSPLMEATAKLTVIANTRHCRCGDLQYSGARMEERTRTCWKVIRIIGTVSQHPSPWIEAKRLKLRHIIDWDPLGTYS
ncbi:hypothetical protein PIB30_052081 [Stylosanthes scabra]|uniref:Uncharacterized protein n=1 Tax=Stylosanthes scabra TaxID=79078 RepID=A0ABU6ZGU8_9FABA|nr:hypothetical protein [Stylosanthes scabra]